MNPRGPKTEFMQDVGYTLYSDTGNNLLDILSQHEPKKLSQEQCDKTPFVQLFYISRQLTNRTRSIKPETDVLGVTPQDRDEIATAKIRDARIFGEGFDDLDFPFHFTPALMQDMFMSSKEQLGLTEEDFRTFTMADFASILREEWFQDMLTDTAKTINGQWGGIGKYENDYSDDPYPIHNRVMSIHPPQEAYDVHFENTDYEGTTLAVAKISLSKVFKQHLVGKLRGEDSVGCPVAAKNRIVDPENPHTKNLVANGRLTLREKESGKVVGTQKQTPIERSAVVLADFIDKYIEAYGEPRDH